MYLFIGWIKFWFQCCANDTTTSLLRFVLQCSLLNVECLGVFGCMYHLFHVQNGTHLDGDPLFGWGNHTKSFRIS
ncbi:hypothetical protein PAHAL_1G092200 [Panicum hallii]|jgi:hypothetical protein|uniref:Uncharacterized protein n=1 Tax=Panicum hallii TaxID=206008 RepID=A0A2T8KUL7_9POAL|nr:hypothetical protein PAHAL_1G092200 [Panicum hallii]